jgi:alpha-aminoadipate/glutamate carrier protein LysW
MEKNEIKSSIGIYDTDGIKPANYAKDIKKPKYDNKNCPDCDAKIQVPDGIEKGEILSCPGCGLELEVKEIKGNTLDLKELTIEGEDWGE